jgi:hypothetical protein
VVFKRISLAGSAELFKETARPPDSEPEPQRPPGIHPLSTRPDTVVYYNYGLTETQVRTLVDALQKLKYPHTLKNATRTNMEEFERLEGIRQLLLDGLR